MVQKKFLTASEVFQLFGLDATALEKLVQAGAVEALQDQNTFRFRSEDFAKLVRAGKLKPRASAEMFQVDDEDAEFMDLKDEDKAIKFDEDMLFLELDEKALDEQAANPNTPYRTPVVPEQWFEDTEVSIDATKGKSSSKRGKADEGTDFDQKPVNLEASDSDVRLFPDDADIDLDLNDAPKSGSDSDVRLVGPVTSSGSSRVRKPAVKESDSDVSLAQTSSSPPKSDSDVILVTTPTEKPVPPVPNRPAAKLGDSDSDVRLSNLSDSAIEIEGEEDTENDLDFGDSSIRFERSDEFHVPPASETEVPTAAAPSQSKSDIPISTSELEVIASSDEIEVLEFAEKPAPAFSDDDVVDLLGDEIQPLGVVKQASVIKPQSSESDIVVVADEVDQADAVEIADDESIEADSRAPSRDSDITFEDKPDSAVLVMGSDYGSGIVLEQDSSDSGVQLEQTDSGVRLVSRKGSDIVLGTGDSDIALQSAEIQIEQSGSDVQLSSGDSDVQLDVPSGSDSAFALEETSSGMSLLPPDSQISLEATDSGISLEGGDSGISLEATDSGISLESGDSGISLLGPDSGITLDAGDSGISLTGPDSGISLDMGDDDLNKTFTETNGGQTRFSQYDGTATDQLHLADDLNDSALELNADQTMELGSEDSPGSAATVAFKDPNKKGSTKQMALSEAFQLDQPLEVQDLDIADDLDAAGDEVISGDSVEFAEAGEEVLDVSDEAFNVDDVSMDSIASSTATKKSPSSPSTKRRMGPTEPAWGLSAVAPIACAALVMVATATVLWGGLATMWTGQELPAPAGAIVSMLAGLSPY